MLIREISVSPRRVMKATPVFETYWPFAAKRQYLFMRRINGEPAPWTDDPVLAAHRFTNVYRAADRVSQYLIANVIYRGPQAGEEVLFRTPLFKFFNRIETWEELSRRLGDPSWRTFHFDRYARTLDAMLARGERVYSAAYIMPERPALDTSARIEATGDIVAGDNILFYEPLWATAFNPRQRRSPAPARYRVIVAEVVRESYGPDKQQHSFTPRVLESSGCDPFAGGTVVFRKGRNIHRNGCWRLPWPDQSARETARLEKHSHGNAARQERDARRLESEPL
jgi:hypothetical protein